LIKIEDIFENRKVLKRTVKKGVSTSKPDKSSEIFFNYQIYDLKTETQIYSSGTHEFASEDDKYNDLEYLKSSGLCYYCYLDEYKISRLLKNSLKFTKKLETAEIRVFEPARYIKYGADYEHILKYSPNLENLQLKYIIQLYNFTEATIIL
jgi:hypothetical protein